MKSDNDGAIEIAARDSFFPSLLRHAMVAFLGAVFAVALYKLWSLEGRWFYIVIVAIVLLSISAMAASKFSKLLLVLLMFGLPFAGFGKWLFIDSLGTDFEASQVYAGLISIGIYEFLLAGLYMSWFFRIFVSREQRLPGIYSMDLWVMGVVLAYIISIPGSIEPKYGIFSLVNLLKHVALYYYVSRNFQYRHVRWFLIAMTVTIFLNTALGGYQKLTGNLIGIALDKGAGSSQLHSTYTVYGLTATRATGTTYDSHSLGMLMAMSMQFCLVFLLQPGMRPLQRGAVLIVLGMSTLTLLLTYSRTAWLAALTASFILMAIMLFRWRDTKVLSYMGIALFAGMVVSPWVIEVILDRFQRGATEVLDYRFEQWAFAIKLWLQKPLFGHGVGNYMEAIKTVKDFGNTSTLPVHNMYLWILCDTGIFGTVVFWGMILSAMKRFWSISKNRETIVSCLSLAIITSFIVFFINAITNPDYREPTVSIIFWFYISFAVIFPEFHKMEKEGTLRDNSQLT